MTPLSRRDFLRVSALATGSSLVAACVPQTATPAAPPDVAQPTVPPEAGATLAVAPPASEASVGRFKEAPMLADLVASGTLPPVDERLPQNPGVVPVMESIGQYGGTMRRGHTGLSDAAGPAPLTETTLIWYQAQDLSLRPVVLESWETNDDATVWTLRLRAGTRWSDGTPFTTEAFRWYWEEQLNEELTPVKATRLMSGSPRVFAELETPDDQTAIISFAEPKPMFAYDLTLFVPLSAGHYMQQFHKDYADADDLDRLIAEAGVATWTDLYFDRNNWANNPDKPTLGAFVSKNPLADELFLMERNPYYCQVDSEGQQLPYLDQVNHRMFTTPDVFNLWIVNGEVDFSARHVDLANFTLYKTSEESGGYRVLTGARDWHVTFFPNQTAQDPRVRELFADRRVRLAISHAMNREEMNELVYDGLATPRQHSPIEKSPQFYPALSNAYLEYDVELANSLLDEAGYSERDAEGFRLWKDGSGEPVSFVMEDYGHTPTTTDMGELTVRYLADVGIRCSYTLIERSLWNERASANMFDAAIGLSSRCILPLVEYQEFLGMQTDRPWCSAYTRWRADPSHPAAEEPPSDHFLWRVWEIWDQIAVEADEEERNRLFVQIMDIWAEELPVVSLLGELPALAIVKNGFRNFLDGYPVTNTTRQEWLQNPETFYWDDPAQHA